MRIGVACFPTYGGSGVVASELAVSLAGRGHTVHLFSSAPPFRLTRYTENLIFHEVEDFRTPAFPQTYYTLDLAAKMASTARAEGIDLLHAHYAIPHSVSCIIAREALRPDRVKVVTTLHGTDITLVGTDSSYAGIVRYAIEASDAVTAVSEDLVRRTRRAFSTQKEIRMIHNFVDCARLRPAARDPKEPFTIVHISNFRPLKRTPDVVRAFKAALDGSGGKAARLLLAGDGPDLPEVRRLVRQLKLQKHVRFLGRQDSVEEILTAADLLILASESESFGLVALEAMAMGLPVVATDSGGIREVVAHEETGYLEPVGDVAALARRCSEIARDPALARRLGQAGRRRAEERFCMADGIRRYEALYESVLAAPPGNPV